MKKSLWQENKDLWRKLEHAAGMAGLYKDAYEQDQIQILELELENEDLRIANVRIRQLEHVDGWHKETITQMGKRIEELEARELLPR